MTILLSKLYRGLQLQAALLLLQCTSTCFSSDVHQLSLKFSQLFSRTPHFIGCYNQFYQVETLVQSLNCSTLCKDHLISAQIELYEGFINFFRHLLLIITTVALHHLESHWSHHHKPFLRPVLEKIPLSISRCFVFVQ